MIAGECGELCEIFQWRGKMAFHRDNNHFSSCNILTDAEKNHIGEELSDVFIYSTRLADVCKIDLAKGVAFHLNKLENQSFRVSDDINWYDISFDEVYNKLVLGQCECTFVKTLSTRDALFHLQSQLGIVNSVLLRKTEDESSPGLTLWTEDDVKLLTTSLGNLCLSLFWISKIFGLNLKSCVEDKFIKNAKKYPAGLSKGSSAKYTAYITNKGLTNMIENSLKIFGLIALGYLIGKKGFM